MDCLAFISKIGKSNHFLCHFGPKCSINQQEMLQSTYNLAKFQGLVVSHGIYTTHSNILKSRPVIESRGSKSGQKFGMFLEKHVFDKCTKMLLVNQKWP